MLDGRFGPVLDTGQEHAEANIRYLVHHFTKIFTYIKIQMSNEGQSLKSKILYTDQYFDIL